MSEKVSEKPPGGSKLVSSRELASIREAFGKALVEMGRKNSRIVVLDGDLAPSTRTALFAKEFPERFIEVGIAEQNMVGIAAGLAAVGYIPFACTFGVFITKKACDQVSISVAYPRLNVKLVGAYSGLFSGKTGATHQAIEDIAIMRAIPNMTVVVPADAVQLAKALEAIVEYEGPVYFRVARDVYPVIFDESYEFRLGRAVTLREGKDASIIATGIMTHTALEAAEELAREGIDVRVINMCTIKPIDEEAIVRAAEETGGIVTAENHSIIGGLGSAVAEVLVERCPVPMRRVGIRDTFGESGPDEELREKYGLTSLQVREQVYAVIETRGVDGRTEGEKTLENDH